MKEQEIVVEFPCECGGTCTVTKDVGGKNWAFVHTLPYCPEFEQMEPGDYLHRNRKRITAGDN